ncbi:MAG: ABC transporter substrate-binding protein [Clostridiaceae bacterium]|nr:ABC transporter substrate-binding protein [Clostridiaceae bacterium]
MQTDTVFFESFSRKSTAIRFIVAMMIFFVLTSIFGCRNPAESSAEVSSKDGIRSGGEVIVGITQEPSLFDPHTVVAAGDEEILFNIFEGLVKCTSDGQFVPALATDYTISEDATTYIFNIRTGVKFHNGDTLTPEDVVFSLKRASGLLTGTALKPDLAGIKDVRISGENEVTVEFISPDAEMIPFFTTAIIPESVSDIGSTPIGTGPFVFLEYRVGESVVLGKNNAYWQEGLPYLDKVTFKITAGMDAAFLELQSGSIDIFPYLTADKAEQIKDRYQILSGNTNMVQVLALNNAAEPFNNPLVRQAVNYAIDRQDLSNLIMEGQSTLLTTGMSPAMGDYYDATVDGTITYNPDKAKALLEEAGYPDGFRSTIKVPSNYQIHVDTAIVLADQLARVGIMVDIVSVDWATWLSDVYQGRNYDSTVIALTSEYTPRDVLSRYVSTSEGNFINYFNSDFDSIYSQIQSEISLDERIALYKQLQQLLVSDYASVYLQDPKNIVAVKNEIKGYLVYPIYVQDMSTVYFAE